MSLETFVVPALMDGIRLDRAVSMATGVSRARALALVEGGAVAIDGVAVTSRMQHVHEGAQIEVRVDVAIEQSPVADPTVPFEVIHVDEEIIVVAKPAGVVVHPGAGRAEGTLVAGLLARFPDLAETPSLGALARPGIVHRLDEGTSGLLVVARSSRALENLKSQIEERSMKRRYLAAVVGRVEHERGTIDAPIGRSARSPTKMAVTPHGKAAKTHYRVLEHGEAHTVLLCDLESGRTHQIRVHLASVGHPVLGDRVYGRGRTDVDGLSRPALHAVELRFRHPGTEELMTFRSEPPRELDAWFGAVDVREGLPPPP